MADPVSVGGGPGPFGPKPGRDRGSLERAAVEARQLLANPLLREVLAELREDAMGQVITGADRETRELARYLVLALDSIGARLAARVDAKAHEELRESRRQRQVD